MPPSRLLQSSSRLASKAIRGSSSRIYRPAAAATTWFPDTTTLPGRSTATVSFFSTTSPRAQDPAVNTSPLSSATTNPAVTPVEMTDSEYHAVADEYLDRALARFEEVQDQSDEIDVEYSSGVMTVRVPEKGTYVINKQPPNKQIWLSSPISGPKRYDWCTIGNGQADKEGTGTMGWAYLRDGTTLNQLILEELGMDLDQPLDG